MNVRALASILLLLAIPAVSQTPKPADSTPTAANTPVGHWMAEHPSQGGIGSWWDFRPDGTFTMHPGAMVTGPVTHTSTTLMMPSGTKNGPPIPVEFRVDGTKLHFKVAGAPDKTFTRDGPAPSSTDPLLGKWRPDPSATPPATPEDKTMEEATTNGRWMFSGDGTVSVRVPFTAKEGTWDATAHTFKFAGEPLSYSYDHTGPKLVLGQPPNNQTTDTYLPDPVL